MNTTEVLPEKTTETTPREWHIVPDPVIPDHYILKTRTSNEICTLILSGKDTEGYTQFLNLITAAPELQDIAEMFRDSMKGKRAETAMIFDLVCKTLHRLQ